MLPYDKRPDVVPDDTPVVSRDLCEIFGYWIEEEHTALSLRPPAPRCSARQGAAWTCCLGVGRLRPANQYSSEPLTLWRGGGGSRWRRGKSAFKIPILPGPGV
jgi:hypothetical protein